MKNKFYIMTALVISLTGCSNIEDGTQPTGNFPEDHIIRIVTEVNAPVSRAGYDASNLESFGLIIHNSENIAYDYNSQMVKSNNDWNTADGQQMLWDNARTPVQWSDKEHAGFTTGTPWLKVNANYKEINVESQEKDEDSVLNYYRKLTALRKSPEYKEVFTYGTFVPEYESTDNVMAYYRVDEGKRMLIAANFGTEPVELKLNYPVKRVALSNMKKSQVGEKLQLESCEVIVLECM